MYGKIFEQIYDGTLADHWEALVTFQQMIVLATADGVVDMTPAAMSRRTGIPLEIIERGIAVLESPDPSSRTEGMDGQRIARLDAHRAWGWFLVNHEKYRDMVSVEERRERDRERKRKERARIAVNDALDGGCPSSSEVVRDCPQVSEVVQDRPSASLVSRHTDTDTDTNTSNAAKPPRHQYPEAFETFWNAYPANGSGRKRGKQSTYKHWRAVPETDRVSLLAACRAYAAETDARYVKDPERFLKADFWRSYESEPETAAPTYAPPKRTREQEIDAARMRLIRAGVNDARDWSDEMILSRVGLASHTQSGGGG